MPALIRAEQEPLKRFDADPLVASVTRLPEVVVVGAGIVGASIAYVLARRGAKVVLMDDRGIGSGSTGHGHGAISLVGRDFRQGPHFRLGQQSAALYREFTDAVQEASGLDPMYHEADGLTLAIVEEEEAIFRDSFDQLRGLMDLRWISGDDARRLEPRITADALAAVHYRHGQVDAYRMSIAEAQAVERLGGRLVLQTATGLVRVHNRIVGVRHSGGQLSCEWVVLAMGAWARQAEQWIDFPIPVRPLHGEVLNVRLPGPKLRAFIITARHGPILQRKDGVVLVGSIGGVTMSGMDVDAKHVFDPWDQTSVAFDLDPKAGNALFMIEQGIRVLPPLAEAELIAHLAGVRPLSADRMPIIGPVPGLEGVILATGHGTKGIHLAPITAEMVADIIMQGKNLQAAPLEPFLPDRFAAPIGDQCA